jgi:hypothetical protein
MRGVQLGGTSRMELSLRTRVLTASGSVERWELTMGRYALLWMLGVPIPVLLLIYFFGGLN